MFAAPFLTLSLLAQNEVATGPHDEAIASLKEVLAQVENADVKALAAAMNDMGKDAGAGDDGAGGLLARHPEIVALFAFDEHVLDGAVPKSAKSISESQMRAALGTVSKMLKGWVRCVSRPTYDGADCKPVFKSCLRVFGYAGEDVYEEVLTATWELERRPAGTFAGSPETRDAPAMRAYVASCREIAGAAPYGLRPRNLADYPSEVPEWTYGTVVGSTPSWMKDHCAFTEEQSQLMQRIRIARHQHPDDWYPKTIVDGLDRRLAACRQMAAAICSDIYLVKGTAILVYPTAGCELRKVTATDVQADIDKWRSAGMTEAQLLEHSQLLDYLDACQAASGAIAWRFVEPKVAKDCKPRR